MLGKAVLLIVALMSLLTTGVSAVSSETASTEEITGTYEGYVWTLTYAAVGLTTSHHPGYLPMVTTTTLLTSTTVIQTTKTITLPPSISTVHVATANASTVTGLCYEAYPDILTPCTALAMATARTSDASRGQRTVFSLIAKSCRNIYSGTLKVFKQEPEFFYSKLRLTFSRIKAINQHPCPFLIDMILPDRWYPLMVNELNNGPADVVVVFVVVTSYMSEIASIWNLIRIVRRTQLRNGRLFVTAFSCDIAPFALLSVASNLIASDLSQDKQASGLCQKVLWRQILKSVKDV